MKSKRNAIPHLHQKRVVRGVKLRIEKAQEIRNGDAHCAILDIEEVMS